MNQCPKFLKEFCCHESLKIISYRHTKRFCSSCLWMQQNKRVSSANMTTFYFLLAQNPNVYISYHIKILYQNKILPQRNYKWNRFYFKNCGSAPLPSYIRPLYYKVYWIFYKPFGLYNHICHHVEIFPAIILSILNHRFESISFQFPNVVIFRFRDSLLTLNCRLTVVFNVYLKSFVIISFSFFSLLNMI